MQLQGKTKKLAKGAKGASKQGEGTDLVCPRAPKKREQNNKNTKSKAAKGSCMIKKVSC